MRHTLSGSVLLLIAALLPCACQTAQDEAAAKAATPHQVQPSNLGTMHMTLADGDVYLGAQPTQADLAAAARYPGIKSVLNLRREGELKSFDEAATLNDLGVAYENVPVGGPDQLTDQALDESINSIEHAPRPLLLHCASGNRAGAIWMAYRMLADGYSQDRALEEARQVGLHSDGFIPVVVDYVNRRQAAMNDKAKSASQ